MARKKDVWAFWQQSQEALVHLNGLMQQTATIISQESPEIPLPPDLVRDIKRNLSIFQQKFALMVREQKRKAAH